MGGYVALAFCHLYPHRVNSLILADTRAGTDSDEARRGREESAQRALREGMDAIAEAMFPKLLSSDTLAQKPETVARVREMMNGTRPEGAAAALRGMAVRRDQTSFLSEISVPTLILVGSDDILTPPEKPR
jgi:pimeloyl-ACP methyl ester carboxylesterase